MMNAGNLKGKTRQTSDWRRRMIAFVSALTLLISSCGLTAFAESDEDIYSDPVTAPIPAANTSPEPEEGEAQATPAPEGQPEEGTEPQEATGEGTETEGEPEVSEEPEDLTVYESGTLTAEADGVGITVDYTAEARVPEGAVLTLARAAGGDLYSALKSASKVLKTEEDATWKRELGEDAVFYAITLTNPEGNEIHPETGVTLTCTNLEIPADATGFVTGDNAENLDWKDTLTVGFLPDAIGYAYLKQVQIGTVTLTHEDRDYMVTAAYGPDAGFPAGTELKVREILPGTSEYALYSGMTDEALNEDWAEITLERYFDIAFVANGEEMEPKADVDVQIVFRDKIEQNEETEVAAVHIENNEANVIEADTDSTKSARHDDEAIDTVTFTSDSFSVYGVVQKKKIITKVLAADGNTYEIEISYTQEAEIPEESQVKVEEIPEGSDLWEAYRKQTAAALNADDVRLPGLYDISIIDAEGAKIEPKAPVSVSIKLANAEANNEDLHVVHFTEEIPQELVEAEAKSEEQTEVQPIAEENKIESEKIKASVEGDTVTFDTKGFSVYAFAYTIITYYKTASGETYKITLNYDENSGIPAGAVLKVKELQSDTTGYQAYLDKAAETLGKNKETFSGARFFDIEIQKDGEKIEPNGNVIVSIALDEMPTELENVTILHYQNDGVDTVEGVEVTSADIRFKAESFSVYGVLTEPSVHSAENLDGKTAVISCNDYYLTSMTIGAVPPNNPIRIKHTQNAEEAALWCFKATGNESEYYIYTYINAVKKYMHISPANFSDSNRYHLSLEESPQSLNVMLWSGSSDEYNIFKYFGSKKCDVDLWDGGTSEGYAVYANGNHDNQKLTFKFNTVANDNYAVIVKYGEKYYAVQHDGSLDEVKYNEADNTVEMANPLLWDYVPNGSGYNLFTRTEGKTFYGGGGVANTFYNRYINADEPEGLAIESASNPTDRADESRFVFENNHIRSTENDTNYLGLEFDSDNTTPVRIAGQKSADKAVEILLAKVDTTFVPNSFARNHAVNHIDISIHGEAVVNYLLPKGTYYKENGDEWFTVEKGENRTIPIPVEVPVSLDDIKKAEIIATDKNGKVLNNAFYITGYSGNEGDKEEGLPTQVRIEGSFKVSSNVTTEYPSNWTDQENMHWKTGNNNWDWSKNDTFRQIRGQRKASQITYSVSVTKSTDEFYLKIGNEYICDKEGNKLKAIATVTLSGDCSYWSSKNKCPGIDWNGTGGTMSYGGRDAYNNGCIVGNGIAEESSGIDFVIGGTTDAGEPSYPSVTISKFIVDKEGNLIPNDGTIKNTFKIYQFINDTPEQQVADPNSIEYSQYGFVNTITVPVSAEGSGSNTYELSVESAMIYIEELKDQSTPPSPETITVNGHTWNYVKTYIETEKVYSTDDASHKTGDLTIDMDAYKSKPEVVGKRGSSPYEEDLYFNVYNVYEPEKTTIKVKKHWPEGNIPEGAYLNVLLKRYKLVDKTAGSVPVVIPPDGGTPSGGNPPTGETVKLTIKYGKYDQGKPLAGFNGIDVPKGCTVTITVNGKVSPQWGVKWWNSDNPSYSYNYGAHRLDGDSGVYTLELDQNTTIGVSTGYNDDFTVSADYSPKLSSSIDDRIQGTNSIFDLLISSASADEPIPVLTLDTNAANKPTLPTDIPQTKEWVLDNGWSQQVELNAVVGWSVDQPVDVEDGSGNVYLYYIDSVQEYGFDSTYWSAQKGGQVTWGDHETNSDHSDNILSVTNTYTPPQLGGLTIHKTVTNIGTPQNVTKTYYFGVYDSENPTASSKKAETSIELNNTSEGYATVSGLIYGTYYVYELTGENGDPITDGEFTSGDKIFTVTSDPASSITVNGSTGAQGIADVTINNNEEGTGSLIVTKSIQGDDANLNDRFNFTVTQTNTPKLTGTYGGMTFEDGVATFELGNTESKSAENLPYGFTYTVNETEANQNGYGTTVSINTSFTERPEEANYTIRTGETETVTFTNTKSTEYAFKVTKEWIDIPLENTENLPTIKFDLMYYLEDEQKERGHVHENYHDIELSYPNWSWGVSDLPTEKDGKKITYYVKEHLQGNTRNVDYDMSFIPPQLLDKYQIHIEGYAANGQVKGTWEQPYEASITGNTGELTIRNRAPSEYMQMDIKKKFLEWRETSPGVYSLYTVTQESYIKSNKIIEVQIYRRYIDERGGDYNYVTGWISYGNTIFIGYEPDGTPYCDPHENPFSVTCVGGDWHFWISNSGQNQGLPRRGFEIVGGSLTPVRYQYILKEVAVYDGNMHRLDEEWASWLPYAWDAIEDTAKQIQIFPLGLCQDQDRFLNNTPSTTLTVKKDWTGTTDVQEVYVKIFRKESGSADPAEDFTHILSQRVQYPNEIAPNYFPNGHSGILDTTDGREWIILKPSNWEVTIHSIDIQPNMLYTIKEVGYKDASGTVHTSSEDIAVFNPQYFKTNISTPQGDGLTLTTTKADNKLIVKNTVPLGSLNIVKTLTNDKLLKNEFTFDVVLTKADGSAYVGDVTVTDRNSTGATRTTDSDGKITVQISGEGTATIANIPAGIKYEITEKNVAGWRQVGAVVVTGGNANETIESGETETATITNEPTVEVPASKVWAFAENSNITKIEGKDWPEGVTVHVVLYSATGENAPAATSNSVDLTEDQTSYTFENLPKYSGEDLITYSVVEAGVTGVDTDKFTVSVEYDDETKEYIITNTEKTTSITVNKQWFYDGEEVEDDIGINKIYFNLYKDGSEVAYNEDPYEITAEKEWTFTVEDLPLGTYTVKEVTSEGVKITDGVEYETDDEDQTDSTTHIIIKNTLIDVEAVKTWESELEKWPENVTVEFQLQQDGNDYGDPVTIDKDTLDHKAVWDKLPAVDYESGTVYAYTVTETVKIGETPLVQGTNYTAGEWTKEEDSNLWTINNELITRDIPVLKTWADGTPHADAVRFELQKGDGTTVTTDAYGETITNPVILNTTNGWTATFEKLPILDANGEEIEYSVVETGVLFGDAADAGNWKTPSDYFTVSEPEAYETAGYSITNTPKTTERHAVKNWVGDNSIDGHTRPSSIMFTLIAKEEGTNSPVTLSEYNITNAEQTVEADSDGNMKADWTGLPKYSKTGRTIIYDVEETLPAKYTQIEKSYNEETFTFTITNTLIPLRIIKVDDDANPKQLSGAVFELRRDNGSGYSVIKDGSVIGINTEGQFTVDGNATLYGITDGNYQIVEISAPAGYIKTNAVIDFTVTKGEFADPDVDGTVIKYTAKTDSEPTTFQVVNTPGAELPATGGSGTLIYTIAGIFLITLAGTLLVARKRKANR